MIDSAQAGYEKYEAHFQELGDYYLSIMNGTLLESLRKRKKSRIFFPRINAKVKRIVSSFQESYFSTDTFAKLDAPDEENADKTVALQEAVDYYSSHKMLSLFETFSPMFYYVSIFGTVVARTYWDGEKPQIDHVHLKDIRFDPSARTVNDIRFYVHDIYMTVDDIKVQQRAGIYDRTFNAEELGEEEGSNNDTKHARIKLQEVYTQNSKGKWMVSTFYDGAVVIRKDTVLNDGNPFTVGGLIPQIEQPQETDIVRVYFDSIISATIPLQNEVNVRRNQQIDAIKKHLEPQMLIPTASGINPTDAERGSRFLRIKQPTAVQILPSPNINSSAMDVQQLDHEMSENIGISAQQNGIGGTKQQTATESSILSNEGNARNQAYMRGFNETFFKRIFKRVALLVWKHGDARFFAGVSRDEEFEFVARINTGLGATNKEIQLSGIEKSFGMVSNLMQMAMAVQDVETAKQSVVAGKKLVREALPLMGIENVDEYLGEENNEQQLGNQSGTNHGISGASGVEGVASPFGGDEQPTNFGLPIGYGQQ